MGSLLSRRLSRCGLWVRQSVCPKKWSDVLKVETKMFTCTEPGMPACCALHYSFSCWLRGGPKITLEDPVPLDDP